MQRSLQRIVRSTWTESGIRNASVFCDNHSVRSGIARRLHESRGFAPHFAPPCPTFFPHASAVVSQTSWVRLSGGAYLRLLLFSGCCSRSRLSSTVVAS